MASRRSQAAASNGAVSPGAASNGAVSRGPEQEDREPHHSAPGRSGHLRDVPPPEPEVPERMGELDSLLWSLESDPLLRPNIVIAAYLDKPPSGPRLLRHLESVTRRVPRLRQRVAPSPLGVAPPRWELDGDFEVVDHLRRLAAPAGVSVEELARPLITEAFDRTRPLWQVTVVEGLPDGRSALLLKLHHALTDGVGAVALAAELFDMRRNSRQKPMPPVPGEPASTDFGRAWDDIDRDVRGTWRLARRAVPWALRALADTLDTPENRASDAFDTVRSLRRVAGVGFKPLSPVMTGRSRRAEVATLSYPLDELAAAAKAAVDGGTVNDAYLAAVAGGLRYYHRRHDVRPLALRLGIPVDQRPSGSGGSGSGSGGSGSGGSGSRAAGAGHDGQGNEFAPLRLILPIQISNPSKRVAQMHSLVEAARREPGLELIDAAAAAINHVPGLATSTIGGAALRATDAVASNVTGSPVPLYIAGSRVDSVTAWGPRSGAALNVTLLSYCGRAQVAVNADPAAVPDGDKLLKDLDRGFSEVLAIT